jgi:Uncharacterised nucleotidyltransferase
MDIFNRYPPATLECVTEGYANLVARHDWSCFESWGDAEWALAPQTAFVLGVGALVAASMCDDPQWLTLPLAFRSALTYQYEMNARRVARLSQEFADIVAQFDHAQIALIPLKGIVLLQSYYRDPAMRPLADIDLMIHSEDLGEAQASLARLGYMLEEDLVKPNFVRPDNREPICFDSEHPDNPRRVEMHLRLEDEFRGSTIEWTHAAWELSQPLPNWKSARELNLQTIWAHLLSHTSRDIMTCRVRLIQLYDIKLMAQTIDACGCWSKTYLPQDDRAARFMYPALALVNRYFGQAIPDAYVQKVRAQTSARLRAWCERQSLFDVSWLGGKHLGSAQTLSLWAHSPHEALAMALVMWQRRTLRLHHLYPTLAGSRWFFLAYAGYLLDQLRGQRKQRQRRGRWDFAGRKEN